MKFAFCIAILLASLSAYSAIEPPYKVRCGFIEYTFIDRNNKNMKAKKYCYYFEKKGRVGYVDIMNGDSLVSVCLIKDSFCFRIVNDSVISKDTFKSIINFIFNDNGIILISNFDKTLRCNACHHSLKRGRFLKFCKSWSITPELYGNWFAGYKGTVFGLEEIRVNEKQLRLIYKWNKLKFHKLCKNSKELERLSKKFGLNKMII